MVTCNDVRNKPNSPKILSGCIIEPSGLQLYNRNLAFSGSSIFKHHNIQPVKTNKKRTSTKGRVNKECHVFVLGDIGI